ncbi:MAG: hypothetical protein M0T75_08655, partial [Chloroflexi bacterium]|nr:hypothetical protein [Chloroflexota bacterium]
LSSAIVVFSVSSVSQFQRREDDAVAVSMPGQVRCYTNSRDTTSQPNGPLPKVIIAAYLAAARATRPMSPSRGGPPCTRSPPRIRPASIEIPPREASLIPADNRAGTPERTDDSKRRAGTRPRIRRCAMQKSIAAIVGAALAVLLVTASVAAADPFGWRTSGQSTYGNGAGSSWNGNNAGNGCCTNWTPAVTAIPTASQPAATAQPTARPSATSTPTRHQVSSGSSGTQNRMTQRQTTQYQDHHGSDWCDDYGRDDHGSSWH